MLLVLIKRFLGKRQARHPTSLETESAEALVERIQAGDQELRNQFIIDYQPFVAKVTSRFSKRYIDPERDDEFSIALTAFDEAITKFSPEAGSSFLGFAETVMRRRLIDYVRKIGKHADQIPYSAFDVEDDEDNTINPVEIHQAIDAYERDRTTEERGYEIAELDELLSGFGISFLELVDASPKHVDSRRLIMSVAMQLAEQGALMEVLHAKKQLPIKEMLDIVEVSRKTLERNRKYIIAVAIIYQGAFPYLQEYLDLSNADERGDGA